MNEHDPIDCRALNPELLAGCGVIGLFGVVALIGGNVVGSIVVPGHDWVADTVSDLAAGQYEIIQDVALYAYAAALTACAIGAAHLHPGGRGWSVGIACLGILTMVVTVIGARNEYGDRDSEGIVIHIYLVYAMGVFFSALFISMLKGMTAFGAIYRRATIGCGVLWIAAAPIFFVMPTGYDGIWERGLGVVTAVWVTMFSVFLITRARVAGAAD